MRVLRKFAGKEIDCYDLKSGDKSTFDSYLEYHNQFERFELRVISDSLVNAHPLEGRWFLIFSDECIKNRRFIITNHMNYYKNEFKMSRTDRNYHSRKRAYMLKYHARV